MKPKQTKKPTTGRRIMRGIPDSHIPHLCTNDLRKALLEFRAKYSDSLHVRESLLLGALTYQLERYVAVQAGREQEKQLLVDVQQSAQDWQRRYGEVTHTADAAVAKLTDANTELRLQLTARDEQLHKLRERLHRLEEGTLVLVMQQGEKNQGL